MIVVYPFMDEKAAAELAVLVERNLHRLTRVCYPPGDDLTEFGEGRASWVGERSVVGSIAPPLLDAMDSVLAALATVLIVAGTWWWAIRGMSSNVGIAVIVTVLTLYFTAAALVAP